MVVYHFTFYFREAGCKPIDDLEIRERMKTTAKELIHHLNLLPHPEGGYFRETYRSELILPSDGLPSEFSGSRNAATAIYFLIEKNNFSALHKIKSDETWHFYAGDPLEVIEINETGELKKTNIGSGLERGELFQYTVKANTWFGSRVLSGGEFSLVGCTVAPGFDFRDFEMAKRKQLILQFPKWENIISQMTRE